MKKFINDVKERILVGDKNKKVNERNSVLKEMVENEEEFDQKMFDVKLATLRAIRQAKKEGRTIDHKEFMANEYVEYDKRKKAEVKEEVNQFVENVVGKEVKEEVEKEIQKEHDDYEKEMDKLDKYYSDLEKKSKEVVKDEPVKEEVIDKSEKTEEKENSNIKKFSRTEMNKETGNKQMTFADAINKMMEYASGDKKVELTDDGLAVYESWEDYLAANDHSEQAIDTWFEKSEVTI